jgi:hypothetical protein
MRVEVDDVRLYFDVEGCGLAARDHEMAAEAGIRAIRAKALLLTEMVVELADAWLARTASSSPRRAIRNSAAPT